VHLHSKLRWKGDLSCAAYYTEMKGYVDEMAIAGKHLEDEDMICYILIELDFNLFVEVFTAKTEPQTINDLYSQLEARVEAQKEQQQIRSNAAFRGGRGSNGPMRGRGDGGSRGGGHGGGRGVGHGFNKNHCQTCGKTGHWALHCYKRFDVNYTGEEKHVNTVTTSYIVDTDWYTDTGASDHITSDLDKLTTREKCSGSDQVHAASGSCMPIAHIGQSTIHARNRNLVLKDILYVSNASKNLVSAHKFTHDNNAFFEFQNWYFYLKDWDTRNLLLHERCKNGLYPLPLEASVSGTSSNKHVFIVIKPSMARWHHHLGHASSPIVHRVLSQNKLPHSKKVVEELVCDACQRAKSHQLPFDGSVSMSKAPLELVFSDVWGPAPFFVGRFKYDVSFIDDFSKFTWLYLLKHKLNVFQKFREF
jgi:hypothetical protein